MCVCVYVRVCVCVSSKVGEKGEERVIDYISAVTHRPSARHRETYTIRETRVLALFHPQCVYYREVYSFQECFP